MAYIKNPKYNPNDPKSLRYIQGPDPLQLPGTQMSVAPNMSVPKPLPVTPATVKALDFSSPTSKTSTPTAVPQPKPTPAPIMTPAPNMSVNKPAVPGTSYQTKSGDSLSKIAAANGTSVAEIMKLNKNITDPNRIGVGQNINLPGKAPMSTAPIAPIVSTQPANTGTPVGPTMPGTAPTTPVTPAGGANQGGGVIPNTQESVNPPPPATGNPVTDKSMQDLAKEAAKAGLSLQQYLDIINKQGAPTKQESDKIRNDLGIPDLVDEAYGKPAKTTVDMYRELYEMSDLKGIKESVKKLDDEIASKRADLVTATGELLNNPWLSQASRTGRLRNLNTIAMADIENTLAQKQQYLDLYDDGISEIEKEITRSVFDTGLDRDLSVDKLNYLLTEAERDETFAKRAVEQRALRYVPDFLQNMPQEGAEDFTLSENDTRFDARGNIIAKGAGVGVAKGGKLVNINGVNYIDNGDGTFSLPNLPETPVNPATVQSLDDKLNLIDSILTSDGMGGAVGAYGVGRFTPFSADKDARKEFAANVNRLVDQETLDTLLQLKKQGGSLGAVSEKELAILQNAATNFKTWEIKDENGNPTGEYEVSEDLFKKELERVKMSTMRLRQAANGGQPRNFEEFYILNQDKKEQINNLLRQGITKDEIMQEMSFNKESQTSLNGGSEVAKIAQAIGQFETGGNYTKRGPVVSTGRYKGERALGKYQIMPGNLPQWSKEALGRVVTEQEFMANPQIQDAIAQYKMGQMLAQHGTLENVASVWFSGQPLAKAGNRKDDLGTTVPSYVKNVRSIYNNIG